MNLGLLSKIILTSVVLGFFVLTGCSSRQPINLNIHTEPEGAFIIYRVDSNDWIYLGMTPLNAVEVISEEKLAGDHTFTIKAMRYGYLDQAKEWAGDAVLSENEAKGMIFWTPRLIKNTQ
jgi:hypothetical protein